MPSPPPQGVVFALSVDEFRWLLRVLTVALAAAEEQHLERAVPPTRALLRRCRCIARGLDEYA